MNIALPALLIFLFILPGFIFSHAYYKTENILLSFVPLTSKAMASFIATCLLHITWIWLAVYCLKYKINYELVLLLIAGGQGDKYISVISKISSEQIILAAMYFFSIYFASYVIGSLLRAGIRAFKLDRKCLFLRMDSPWYYLFTMYDCNNNAADGVRIAAVTEVAGDGYLYAGWLDRFYFDSSGALERIVLVGAKRRVMQNDKVSVAPTLPADSNVDTFNERFYPIDGDYFILKYSEIKSLNVQYLKINDL